MSKKYTSSKRCYLIDHHSPQPPIVTLDKLHIEEYETFFQTANIDSLMVYCKDHWGVTYYPSKVPGAQIHKGIQGDWIQEVSRLLKKMDIEFVAYYCIEYDEGAARQFPQWRVQRPDGSYLIRDDEFAKWSLCCYQTGYREYCLSQIEEIVSNYHPDALFLDIFGASLCYCPTCRKQFEERYHYPLPETKEEIAAHISDVTEFLNGHAKDFLSELERRAKAIDPTLAITINFSCHYPKEIRDMLDYQFSEPLLKDNWFSSIYARDTAVGQYPILVPGEASQVYNYLTVNEYLCDLSSIVAGGCRVGMYSGSQHIDGTLDFEEARRLGVTFSEIKKMEPYLEGRTPVKYAGILQSDLSMSINLPEMNPDAILRMKRHNPHQNAVLGAMQLCEHVKIPYSILPEQSLTEELLKDYPLLLLPEVYVIEESTKKLLERYVENGGILISSGQSGLWNRDSIRRPSSSIADLMGIGDSAIHEEYQANRWAAYLKSSGCVDFHGLLSCTTPPVSEHFFETDCQNGAESLLDFILPCVACDFQHWVNWWSPPPGKEFGHPALVRHPYGKGTSYYFAFDFFTMANSFQYPKELFSDLLAMSRLRPVIHNQTEIPDILRTAYFETEDAYLVHQISMMAKQFHGNVSPVNGGILRIQEPVSEAAAVYPFHMELQVEQKDGCSEIRLPDFSIQQIIRVKKSVSPRR